MDRRLPVTLALAVGVLALAWALRPEAPAVLAEAGPHELAVVGPEGVLWEGVVVGANVTALSLLEEAGRIGGFEVAVSQSAAFGPGCIGTYVVSIGGHGERGTGGWNFYVRHPGDGHAWWISESAGCCGLVAGDAVEWRWVEVDRVEPAGTCA